MNIYVCRFLAFVKKYEIECSKTRATFAYVCVRCARTCVCMCYMCMYPALPYVHVKIRLSALE